jgi:hypothetical protein
MARRVNSEMLLVGSLPADSTEGALREAAGFFGDLVFALPDGETGPRAGWVSYEREKLIRPNERVVTVEETESPTGLPRHAYETPVFAIGPGVTELRWDSWPRIDDAIESYAVFGKLRADGVAGLRRRVATASRYISDFGVAMYCGFGRQPGADGTETMREHARVVRTVRGRAAASGSALPGAPFQLGLGQRRRFEEGGRAGQVKRAER